MTARPRSGAKLAPQTKKAATRKPEPLSESEAQKCPERVADEGGWRFHICGRKAVTERGFCRVHDPEFREARRKKRGPTAFERETSRIEAGRNEFDAARERIANLTKRMKCGHVGADLSGPSPDFIGDTQPEVGTCYCMGCEREAALKARIAEVERERDEAIAEQGTLYKLIAQVERERDEARKHPGINDPRVAAINDAVTDFLTRKDNPRLVCFHVPVINCEVLMFAVGEGLPKVISYAQFIHTLERSAGIGADSSTAVERDALRKFSDAYDRCDSNRGAFSCCEQHDCRCMKARHPDKPCECGRDEMDAAYEEARRLRAASEGGERG